MKWPQTPAEIVIWVLITTLTLCFAALIFFVKRYIASNDEHHKKVEGELTGIKKSFGEHKNQMESNAKTMQDTATRLEQSATVFQREIHKELHEIQKVTTQVSGDMRIIQGAVSQLQTTVIAQQKSLKEGSIAMSKQREEMNGIKTTITKINDDLILIGQKKVDKG